LCRTIKTGGRTVNEKEWIDLQAEITKNGSPALKAAQAKYQELYHATERHCWTGGARDIINAAWRAETGKPQLPVAEIDDNAWVEGRMKWLDDQKNPWDKVQSRDEIRKFMPWLKKHGFKNVLEIGVRTGSHAYLMCGAIKKGGSYTGIDIARPSDRWLTIQKQVTKEGIKAEYVHADSANLADIFKGRKFDFIYIDGDHYYEPAKRDYQQALTLLAPGGLIGFHDISGSRNPTIHVAELWAELKHLAVFEVVAKAGTCGVGVIDPAKQARPTYPPPPPNMPPPEKKPAETPATPLNGKRLLIMVNGGLGDAVGITYPAVAAVGLGYAVDVYPITGNACLMSELWAKIPGLRAIKREEAEKAHYYAVLCSTNEATLLERAKGLSYERVSNGNPLSNGTIVQNAMRLLRAIGHDVPAPEAPLKSLFSALKLVTTGNTILIGPGVGRPEANQAKKIPGFFWVDLIRYLPRPVKVIGDKRAVEDWQKQIAEFKDVENMIGKTDSLTALLAVLATGLIYYGPDNGIGHLAAACGVPTVSLFNGTTDPARFSPHGSKARVVLFDSKTKPGAVANEIHKLIQPDSGLVKHITDKLLSVIIATHNEGDEVALTCEDVIRNAGCPVEIIVVDDASTDNSCVNLPPGAKVIKRETKHGVASSRNLGASKATGAALMFLDAHQRVKPETPARMMLAAIARGEIIVPGVAALYNHARSAVWNCKWEFKEGRIRSVWHGRKPKTEFEPSQSFVAPGWCLSRETWDKIGPWPSSLSNWGSTEVCKGLQAFMAGVKITAMRDAVTWHRFRSRFPYHVGPKGIAENGIRVAAICFDRETFDKYLWPRIKKDMPGGNWHAHFDDMPKSEEIKRDAAEFAKHRTVPGIEFIKTYLPDWIKS